MLIPQLRRITNDMRLFTPASGRSVCVDAEVQLMGS